MLIQRIFSNQGNRAPRTAFTLLTAATLATVIILAALIAGCGGGSSSSSNNTVAQVLITPSTISLVSGQVITVSASAVNASNNSVTTTFTFNSSNTAVATVSPAGLVCGGVWDSTFVVCNGNDAQGNPINGTATITATAQAVTSGPVSVSVHPSITSVTVDPVAATCFSNGETHQFVAHAKHNNTDITGQVGPISWSSSDATVVTVDSNGLATAKNGGIAGVVASVGSTTSPASPFKGCMPIDIVLHIAGDPAGNFTFAANLNTTDTRNLQVDVIDEKGAISANAPFIITSNNTTVATMSGNVVTAQSPGGAGLQAVCAPPVCGNGINAPVYSNVFNLTVNGTSPNTITIYAASSFPVPTGQIMPLVPIDASKTPPVAGSALGLPGVPNSIVFTRAGDKAYIGTNVGLAVLDATTKTVTVAADQALGKVLAISPDGTRVIVSNAANDPSTGTPIEPNAANQRVWVFNSSNNTLTTFIAAGVVTATYDDDGFRAYLLTNNGSGTFFVFSPSLTFLTTNLGDTSNSTAATTLASGPFAYVANSAGLRSISTCNNTVQASPLSGTIQLVGAPKNQDQIVALNSTGLNIETVTVTPPAIPVPGGFTTANCTPNVSYSNQFFDFGLGAFTANQLLVASNSSHIAVLPKGRGAVLTFNPTTGIGIATLTGGASTEPLSGGITPDGATLWVGVSGSNTVDRINLLDNQDEVQIPMTFVKVDGTPAPPNLVAVQPK
ncbi:MAG TPA: hypothetical protein VIB39_04530 [Candidatus Angelobacter sp.]|jgi:hypothetical protein